jgi:hypothetical protein
VSDDIVEVQELRSDPPPLPDFVWVYLRFDAKKGVWVCHGFENEPHKAQLCDRVFRVRLPK